MKFVDVKSEDSLKVPQTCILSSGQQGETTGCKRKYSCTEVYWKAVAKPR